MGLSVMRQTETGDREQPCLFKHTEVNSLYITYMFTPQRQPLTERWEGKRDEETGKREEIERREERDRERRGMRERDGE